MEKNKNPYYTYICSGEVAANDYSDYKNAWQDAKIEAINTGGYLHIYKLYGDEETIEDGFEMCIIDPKGEATQASGHCINCKKDISDVTYIRYAGYCPMCWETLNRKLCKRKSK